MKKSYWHFKIGIFLTSVFFFLLCLEIGTRLFIKPPPAIIVENLNKENDSEAGWIQEYGLFLKSNSGLRLKRNAQVVVCNLYDQTGPKIEIKTNSLGFRHEELGKKGPKEVRILALGDSITMGVYIPYKQTYTSRISAYLNASESNLDKKKYVVINAGIHSIDLQIEYAILLERGLKVKPDVVLVQLYLNDAYQSPFLKMTRLPAVFRASYFLRVLFDRIDKLKVMYRNYKWESAHDETFMKERDHYFRFHKRLEDGSIAFNNVFEKEMYANFWDWGYAWSGKYWDKILPLLEMMKETAANEKFKLVIVFFPVAHQITYKEANDEPQRRFAEEMSKRNIFHLDLLPLLKEKNKMKGVKLFYDQCHYNKEGNDFVGKCIADFLKKTVLNEAVHPG